MPLVARKSIFLDCSCFIWRVEESVEWFLEQLSITGIDSAIIAEWHTKRQLEWLAGRYLIYFITQKTTIAVDNYGKPYFLEDSQQFSISHTDNYVGLVLHQKPCGIDIQHYTPKIARILSKFLNSIEDDYLLGLNTANFTQFSHVYWSAKEAVYKAYGKKQLAFKDIFITTAIAPNEEQGLLLVQSRHANNEIRNWEVYFEIKKDFVLAIAQ